MGLQFFSECRNNRNGRKMKWGKNGGERGNPSRGVRKREIEKERRTTCSYFGYYIGFSQTFFKLIYPTGSGGCRVPAPRWLPGHLSPLEAPLPIGHRCPDPVHRGQCAEHDHAHCAAAV